MMRSNYRPSASAKRAHPWLLLPVGIAAALLPATAAAYSYGTVGSDPCHEDIAAAALRQIRIELPAAGPILLLDRSPLRRFAFEASVH